MAVAPDGRFAVVWERSGGELTRDQEGVFLRVFEADGQPLSDPQRVDPDGSVTIQSEADVAADGAGNFLVTWHERVRGGALPWAVSGRWFDRSGAPRGGEMVLHTDGPLARYGLATDDAGDTFVLAWERRVEGHYDVFAQVFDGNGVPDGPEFVVHEVSEDNENDPAVAMDADGDFVVAWNHSASGEGHGTAVDGVYARLFKRDRPAATVVGRHVFYNGSSFDGNDSAANAADDDAIAPDKQALLPGGQASFANVTSYAKGINGVIIDVAGAGSADALGADDFVLRVGTTGDPSSWVDAPAPQSVRVRPGGGAGASDRVTITFAEGAVRNAWLQVTVKGGTRTGLATPDVFYFGNLAGDTGDGDMSFRVNALDLAAVKRALNTTSAVDGKSDFNRDGRVNALDLAAVKQNLNRTLATLTSTAAAAASPIAPSAPATLLAVEARRRVRDELLFGLLD